MGTFRLEPIKNEKEDMIKKVKIDKFELDLTNKKVFAEVKVPKQVGAFDIVISILLVDKESKISIPINYNSMIKSTDLGFNKKRVELVLSKSLIKRLSTIKAYLMADIYPIKEIEF